MGRGPANTPAKRLLKRGGTVLVLSGLAVWWLEAVFLLGSIVILGEGARLDTVPRDTLSHWQRLFLSGQVLALLVFLAGGVLRHSQHAESLASFSHQWLAGLFSVALAMSTFYLVTVAAPKMDRYLGLDTFGQGIWTWIRTTPQWMDKGYPQVCSSLSIVFTAQAVASTGLFVLFWMRVKEERDFGRRPRGRRVPPWRLPA